MSTWYQLRVQSARYWSAYLSLRELQATHLRVQNRINEGEDVDFDALDIAGAEVDLQQWILFQELRRLQQLVEDFEPEPRSFIPITSETDINAVYACVRHGNDLVLHIGARPSLKFSEVQLMQPAFHARFGINWEPQNLYVVSVEDDGIEPPELIIEVATSEERRARRFVGLDVFVEMDIPEPPLPPQPVAGQAVGQQAEEAEGLFEWDLP